MLLQLLQINDLPLAIHSVRRTDNGQGIGHIGYGDNGWSIHSPLHQSKVQLVVQHLLLQLTAGCHQYIDLCLRVAFFEQSDIARQQLTANGQTGTDPQLSKAIPIPHLPLYPTKQSQDPPGIAQKDLPGTGDGKAPSDPVEQTHFVIVFQFLDCKAHRRLRHIELSCRLGSAAVVFAHCTENPHMSDCHNPHPLFSAIQHMLIYLYKV